MHLRAILLEFLLRQTRLPPWGRGRALRWNEPTGSRSVRPNLTLSVDRPNRFIPPLVSVRASKSSRRKQPLPCCALFNVSDFGRRMEASFYHLPPHRPTCANVGHPCGLSARQPGPRPWQQQRSWKRVTRDADHAVGPSCVSNWEGRGTQASLRAPCGRLPRADRGSAPPPRSLFQSAWVQSTYPTYFISSDRLPGP